MSKSPLHNESELLGRLAEGDEAAFTAIYDGYAETIFSIAKMYLKNEEDAGDIVQQIFIHFWETRNQHAEIRNLVNYLFIATRNKVFTYLRDNNRYQRALSGLRQRLEDVDTTDSTSQWLQQKEYGVMMEKAVSGLTSQQKLVYVLAENQGYGLDEIADELHLSKVCVKKHIEMARRSVRSYVARNVPPELLPIVLGFISAGIIF